MKIVGLFEGKYKGVSELDLQDFLDFNYLYKNFSGYSINELKNLKYDDLLKIETPFCNEEEKVGFWRKYTGSTIGLVENIGTLLQTVDGIWLERIVVDGYIYPEWFGAKGDGVTDDSVAIQKAIDYTKTNDSFVVYLKAKKYKINKRLIIDSYHNGLRGHCLLDFSDSLEGGFLVVASTGYEAGNSYGKKGVFSGNIRIKGSGKLQSCKGIEFNSTVEYSNSNLHLTNVSLFQFGTGIYFGDRAYNSLFEKCEIFECGECVKMDAGQSDYGEKITFISCVLYNSNIAVVNDNPSGCFNFVACSFDYNLRHFIINSCKCFLSDSHIESNYYDVEPIHVSGNGGLFSMTGGWVLCSGQNHVSLSKTDVSCAGTQYSNVFFNNLGDAKYLDSGDGVVRASGIASYYITNNPVLISSKSNLLVNGNAYEPTIYDLFINEDTQQIVNRLTGQNINISLSSEYSYSGFKSTKITKNFGGGSPASALVYAPVQVSSVASCEFFYKKPNSQSGIIYISTGYARIIDSSTAPIIVKMQLHSSLAINENSFDWRKFNSGEPKVKAPNWATHYVIVFNLASYNGSGSSLFIDEIEINCIL